MKNLFSLFLFFCLFIAFSVEATNSYSRHTEISLSDQERLDSHTLPKSHPLRPILETIFSDPDIMNNDETLVDGGFSLLSVQQTSYVRILEHPAVPGFLFKIYTNEETRQKENRPGWSWLLDRCIGARTIQTYINDHKIKNYIVPEKWLFELPFNEELPADKQQPVVLIVTKINLLPEAENKQAWLNASKKQIDELFAILSNGYGSFFLTGNIPAARNGKFAFIDTEYPKRKIRLEKVKKFLSPKMQKYWQNKIDYGF